MRRKHTLLSPTPITTIHLFFSLYLHRQVVLLSKHFNNP